MKFKLSFITLEILLFTLYFTETECRAWNEYNKKQTNLTEHPVYFLDFRQIIIDARHVLEEVLSKGRVKVLGVDDWKW